MMDQSISIEVLNVQSMLEVMKREIDNVLFVEKKPGTQVKNEIGKIFRGYNLMVFRSPEQRMDIDILYLTQAYGGECISSGEGSDAHAADDITITIIRDAKPEELFQYFQDHNIRTENPYPGIYYILDGVIFPTQLVVGRELTKDHLWMRALSNKVQKEEMKELLEGINSLKEKDEKESAKSVLEACVMANSQVAKELLADGDMDQELLEETLSN